MKGRFGEAVEPMAVLSTIHVLPKDLSLLEAGYGPTSYSLEYGALVVVPNDEEDDFFVATLFSGQLRLMMWDLLQEGFEWLMLDRDGYVHPDYPRMEDQWKTHEETSSTSTSPIPMSKQP